MPAEADPEDLCPDRRTGGVAMGPNDAIPDPFCCPVIRGETKREIFD